MSMPGTSLATWLATMLIYKTRVFDLYSTNVSSRRMPFEYVGHRGSCATLIVDENDHVGLLPHHRPAIGRTLFELPAGTIDYDRPIEDIMAAELKEETGLRVRPDELKRLTSLYSSPGYSSELVTIFFLRVTNDQRKANETLRWFDLAEINKLIFEGELVDMKTVAAITSYQAIVWKGTGDEIL